MAYDERAAARVRKVLSGRHGVVEKKLMGGLCFMVEGAMCCSVSGKGGLLVRVGEQHEHMLREPHVTAMEMGRRTMRGFVRVAPEGFRTDAALRKWIERGLDFLSSRPAQSPRRKRNTARAADPSRN